MNSPDISAKGELRMTVLSTRMLEARHAQKLAEAVYVLHCFQKKTQKTSKTDLNLAERRYSDLVKELKQ